MLKQLVILLIIVFVGVVAYQIAYASNDDIVPPTPYGPVVNPTFNFKNDGGYVIVKDAITYGAQYSVSFKIKTTAGDGLMLTTGGPIVRTPTTPYMVIYLQSKVVKFIHNGPSGGAALYSDSNAVTDGRWHDFAVRRNGTDWTMYVDGKLTSRLTIRSDDILSPSLTYVGNRPVKSELPGVDGIVGCIANLAINDNINLTYVTTGGEVSDAC